MIDLESIVKFLHENLSNEQLNALSSAIKTHPQEVLNGINLAITRVSYKRSGRLGGRPRTRGRARRDDPIR